MHCILIIDDEPNMRWVLGKALEGAGYVVHTAANGDEGLTVVASEPVDLVLLDLKLRGEDGLAVLRRLRERRPDIVAMILTAYGTVSHAVEAMQLGAADFLRKPFDVEEVLVKIARALERRAMQHEIARLTVAQRRGPAFESLLGVSAAWQQAVMQAQQLATVMPDTLVTGEPGSGRTSLARALHGASARHELPLIEVDMQTYADPHAALFGSNGAWARAGGGTLLLRGFAASVLNDSLVDYVARQPVRPWLLIITAAADALPEHVATWLAGRLAVPPLRARLEDIVPLARHFAADRRMTPQAAQVLENYAWPGNVAELQAVMGRACALAADDVIDRVHVPSHLLVQPAVAGLFHIPPGGIDLEEVEQSFIQQALEQAHGNKSKAADLLGLSRHTLLYRMEKYGIVAPERE